MSADGPPAYNDIYPEAGVSLAVSAIETEDDLCDVLFTVTPPKGSKRLPLDICCVIDTSGSMDATASLAGEAKTEGGVLSVLSLTKHAVLTVIHLLGPDDRLALVQFSNNATCKLPLTAMDEDGKEKAAARLNMMNASGGTNLWGGLEAGLDIIRHAQEGSSSFKSASSPSASGSASRSGSGSGSGSASHAPSSASGKAGRISNVLLLTDGRPTRHPPSGHLAVLQDYLDTHPDLSCAISTFGFGYKLDSAVLLELAVAGGGSYSFIPDASFVGTCFVHAVANMLTTYATNAKLSLEAREGAAVCPGSLAYLDGAEVSWGAEVPLGPITLQQPRSVLVRMNVPKADTKYVRAKVTFDTRDGKGSVEFKGKVASGGLEARVQAQRRRFIETVRYALPEYHSPVKIDKVTDKIKEVLEEMEESKVFGDAYVKAIAEDLGGQFKEAVSKQAWYEKWGRPYLRSLLRAHVMEQCNNFKDPGVQHYGGEVFARLRDEGEDIFVSLPPPKAKGTAARSRGGGRHMPSESVAAASVDMHAYYNASGPCVAADAPVHMADGTRRAAADVRRGDVVAGGGGAGVRVAGVVETRCRGGVEALVSLGKGLRVTPWHPVLHKGKWRFPADVGPATEQPCPAVFSFVVEGGDADAGVVVGGVPCATLGHNAFGDIREHAYWGTTAVIRDLSRMPGWAEEGHVVLAPGCVVRDAKTGLACGLRAPPSSSH